MTTESYKDQHHRLLEEHDRQMRDGSVPRDRSRGIMLNAEWEPIRRELGEGDCLIERYWLENRLSWCVGMFDTLRDGFFEDEKAQIEKADKLLTAIQVLGRECFGTADLVAAAQWSPTTTKLVGSNSNFRDIFDEELDGEAIPPRETIPALLKELRRFYSMVAEARSDLRHAKEMEGAQIKLSGSTGPIRLLDIHKKMLVTALGVYQRVHGRVPHFRNEDKKGRFERYVENVLTVYYRMLGLPPDPWGTIRSRVTALRTAP